MWLTICLHVVILFSALFVPSYSQQLSSSDYCVVGAGPSGLQLAQLLSQASRDYIVFERASVAGSFYEKYPRHGQVISINKRHTGQTNDEFNMRHDWNSLLSNDLDMRVTKYSKSFFPPRSVLVKYLNDFAKRFNLNIQYNTEIVNINAPTEEDSDGLFDLKDQQDKHYTCRTLVMATGMWKENKPSFEGDELVKTYSEHSLDLDEYEGKSVLILGRGNSGFEVADHILGSTNLVHMMSRSRVRLSWETHYVGDLRAINNGLLDTYQLKSLDGLVEGPIDNIRLSSKNGKIRLDLSGEYKFDNFALRDDYDIVISCLGFKYDFSMFNRSRPHPKSHVVSKFPSIKHNYESQHVSGLFFAGTSTHSLDFRKSAGGFIHGFRYTTKALHQLLEWRNHQVQWPSINAPWSHIVNTVIKRINEASGSYQMFQVLGDVIIIDDLTRQFSYLEEYPIKLIHDIPNYAGHEVKRAIVMVFEYGKNFSGAGNDIFRENRATGEPSMAHTSNFLHPVFYYYSTMPTEAEILDTPPKETLPRPDRLHHIVEDFLTGWDAPSSHLLPFRRFLEVAVGTDLRSFTDTECFEMAMTNTNMPVECEQRYLTGQYLHIPESWV